MYEVNSHKYGEAEGEIYTIPSFLQTNYGSKDAFMEYNLTKDYQDIYSISVGGNVSLSFRYKDVTGLGGSLTFNSGSVQLDDELGDASINRLIIPGDGYIPGMTTTLLSSTLDTSKAGYYYNYYLATNGSDYTIRFRVVIKVGNPVSVYPEESLKSNYKDYSGGWRDQLSSYTILEDGVSSTSYITYDNQGNPTKITNFYYEGTRYNHADLSWEGRQLVGIQVYSNYLTSSKIAEIWYTYNDQGIRTSKIIDTNGDETQDEKFVYRLSGDVVLSEIRYFYTTSWLEDYQIIYTYDYNGSLIGFSYFDGISTEDYIYTFNIQGDVTKILKSDGTVVVEYYYDAYGNVTETVGSMSSTIGKYNSMKYRGYKYDDEIRMYYLNSRYYNPEIGRFINGDGLLGEVGNLQTNNMYAYCANNPVMYLDPSGELGFLFWLAVSGLILCASTSVGGYAAAAVMSIWDEEVRQDMNDIGWNPFNSDESLVARSNKVSFYKGQFVIRGDFKISNNRSFSFGIMFLDRSIDDTAYGRDTVKHEWGHFVQLGIVGIPKFLGFYAVPSMLSKSKYYYSLPWERSADLIGGVSGYNWGVPHTPNSGFYSVLYLIGVFIL